MSETTRSDLKPLPKLKKGVAHTKYIEALLEWVEVHQKTSTDHEDRLEDLKTNFLYAMRASDDAFREAHLVDRKLLIFAIIYGFVASAALFLHFV